MLSMGGSAAGYSSPYWLTFKQATERGGHVKKGEKATPVVFWKIRDRKPARGSDEDGDDEAVPTNPTAVVKVREFPVLMRRVLRRVVAESERAIARGRGSRSVEAWPSTAALEGSA